MISLCFSTDYFIEGSELVSSLYPIGLDSFLSEPRSQERGFSLGAVAQLGERLICIQEVAGSIPTSSTNLLDPY